MYKKAVSLVWILIVNRDVQQWQHDFLQHVVENYTKAEGTKRAGAET